MIIITFIPDIFKNQMVAIEVPILNHTSFVQYVFGEFILICIFFLIIYDSFYKYTFRFMQNYSITFEIKTLYC